MKMATKVFAVAAVLGAAGGTMFLSSRSATASGFAGPFAGGTQKDTTLSTSEHLCLDGATCSVYVQYDGGSIGLVGAEMDVPSGFTDSQKVNPDSIITPNKVIAQAGPGEKAIGVAQSGARIYFCESGNCYCADVGGVTTCANTWDIPAGVTTNIIGASTPGRDRVEIFYPQPYPLGSLDTCDSDHKGVLQTLSTTGRSYACDGTTNQMLGYVLSATATIDFASMNTQTTDSKTVTITGALTSDWVHCAPVSGGDMQGTDMHSTVTSADTVTILAHNDTSGTIDPTSMSIKCVIIR